MVHSFFNSRVQAYFLSLGRDGKRFVIRKPPLNMAFPPKKQG
ncbi:hypothetical protein X474_23710 [Dethiosulfatarculus sandiegensis]|uniref:Uncharacterized protein n=1 Tax=Dethiosulfatarculus sandiegensis TaxID=1429043 RepID=A0A0D2J769_9BACT|nr:hypothetical protein X474_23710 [Dethiosulfatarculus sandiegensis]